jgi:hypothetical protein
VAVDRVIKGSSHLLTDGRAYFELQTNPIATVEAYQRTAPTARGIFFLDDRSDVPADGLANVPEGSRIFAPMIPGLVFENGGTIVSALEDLGSMPEQWRIPANFDDFVTASTP